MAGIGSSPVKLGIGEIKLSRAYTIAYTENECSRKNLRINGVLPY
jgi:hypothetical protein